MHLKIERETPGDEPTGQYFCCNGVIFLVFPSGNRCASINAGTLALIDAGIPMKDFVCACSATYLDDTPMLGESEVSNGQMVQVHSYRHVASLSLLCVIEYTVFY